jgi:hypothetical protein
LPAACGQPAEFNRWHFLETLFKQGNEGASHFCSPPLEVGVRSQESGARRKEEEGRRKEPGEKRKKEEGRSQKKCFYKYEMLPSEFYEDFSPDCELNYTS